MKLKHLALTLLSVLCLSASAANEKKTVAQVTEGVQLTTDVDYIVTGTTPFTTAGSVDIANTDHAVLIIQNIKPSLVLKNWMNYIYINGAPAKNGTNCQVKMYGRGTIVFPYASNIAPLTCYTEQNFEGDACTNYSEGHSGGYMKTLTAATLNNQIRSFKLKRGYMVTFAIGTGGWGYSRCFIADQEDLEIGTLPTILDKRISSYRIFKWHNAHKAGLASNTSAGANDALNTSWCYDWGQGNASREPDQEWVPNHIYEDWPSSSTCGSVTQSCHMKTNNEPGNSADDHPQDVATVLGNWQNLMRTGMRLCSESSHDGSMNHLKAFIDSIDARGWRCDILDLHCYWASGFNNLSWYSSNYGNGRPIWISEWIWGASWNKNGCFGNGVTDATILNETKNILNTLNNSAIVERYAYWNSESKGHIYENNRLTSLGEYYANMEVGLAYNPAKEYIPKPTRLEPLSALKYTYDSKKGTVLLEWTDPNGDLMDEIEVRCKLPETNSYTTVATVTPRDKNSSGGIAYSYTADVDEPGLYIFQIRAKAYTYAYFSTNEVSVNVAPAQGTKEIQYGKLMLDNLESNEVKYTETFGSTPCVFIGTITNNNTSLNAGNVVSSARATMNFTYQLFPWQTNKGTIKNNEEIPFLALQEGNYTYSDLNCEVGTAKSNVASDTLWTDTTEVVFKEAFPEGVTPVVLTEIRKPSYTSGNVQITTLNVRVFDVTNTGFKFIIYSEEASGRQIIDSQTVCYLAITPGIGYADEEDGLLIAAGHGTEQIYGTAAKENSFAIATQDEDGNPATDEDGNPVTETLKLSSPLVFAQLQTNNYPVLCMLRRTDVTEKDADGNTWTTGTKVKRILDHDLAGVSSTSQAHRDNLGWVTISKQKEGGSMPTAIAAPAAAGAGSSALTPRVVGRRIIVDGASSFDAYNAAGAKVDAKSTLEPGIYVVKANGKSAKVLVK